MFRKWTGLLLYLENNGSIFADATCHSMKRRESNLFNPVFLTGIYFDVNSFNLISMEQKDSARLVVSFPYLNIKMKLKKS